MNRRTWGRAALAVPLLALMFLAGCGGSSMKPAAMHHRLVAAKKAIDKTPAIDLNLRTTNLPSSAVGLLSATGTGTHQPAFEGNIKASEHGMSLAIPLRSVGGKVQVKLFGSLQTVDPHQYGAPDPASLMSPTTGLSTLLSAATNLTGGNQTRQGKNLVTTIKGVIPGPAMAKVLPTASGHGKFTATFTVNSSNQLTSATLRGPFYPHATVTYSIQLSGYGEKKTIKAW